MKADLEEFKEVCMKYEDTVDVVFWFIYSKGTSKKYKKMIEVNRDSIWEEVLGMKNRPVFLVSLSDDLSYMRLRFDRYVNRKLG